MTENIASVLDEARDALSYRECHSTEYAAERVTRALDALVGALESA